MHLRIATLLKVTSTWPFSKVQKHSSGCTVETSGPENIVWPPLIATLILWRRTTMSSILDVAPAGKGMKMDTSPSVWLQAYFGPVAPVASAAAFLPAAASAMLKRILR